MTDYSIHFRTLAAEAGWDEGALQGIFRQGLNPGLRTELALRDDPVSLYAFISSAIWLDSQLRASRREHQPQGGARSIAAAPVSGLTLDSFPPPIGPRFPPPSASDPSEPMQLDRTRLSRGERERRIREGRCLYAVSQVT